MTHGLLGALAVRSLPTRYKDISLRELTIVAFVAAVFPDIDYLTFWIHPLLFLAEWHRAATHSFVMMPVSSIAMGSIAAILVKARWKWPVYSAVCAVAISTHILSDMITIYGTQIFNPISDYKAVIGTTFVIDGYFTGIVLTGLILSALLKRYNNRYHRTVALLMIGVLLSYLGLQTYFRSVANDFARQYAKQQQFQTQAIHSIPQPFSPTYWKIIIESNDSFHVSYINVMPADWHHMFTRFMIKVLSGNSQTLEDAASNYVAMNQAAWNRYQKINGADQQVIAAWNQDEFSAFRKFAIFPVLYRKDNDAAGTCIWFTDLRYVFPVMLPSFRYGMCNNQNEWKPYRLERNSVNNRKPLQ
jgi:inner membrane protein